MSASATARLEAGDATEPLAQAKKQMKPEYDWAIRNLCRSGFRRLQLAIGIGLQ